MGAFTDMFRLDYVMSVEKKRDSSSESWVSGAGCVDGCMCVCGADKGAGPPGLECIKNAVWGPPDRATPERRGRKKDRQAGAFDGKEKADADAASA